MIIETLEIQNSRRSFLLGALGGAGALGLPTLAWAGKLPKAKKSAATTPTPTYVEHRIPRGENSLYARQYVGKGPTLIMLHGFPDNLHIYDQLAPLIAATGRNVVAFDYMGFGASDKPAGFAYNFDEQKADIEAVVDALKIDKVIPVAHDAGGVSALNYALDHPEKINQIVLLNTFYADTPTLRFPELIELCADPDLKRLAGAIMSDPARREWLLMFQNKSFNLKSTPEMQHQFDTVIQPIVDANFGQAQSAGPAFMAMTGDVRRAVAANDKRVAELSKLNVPVGIIWGENDPYLNTGVAQDFAARFGKSKLSTLPLGHWPQLDDPKAVADVMIRDLLA